MYEGIVGKTIKIRSRFDMYPYLKSNIQLSLLLLLFGMIPLCFANTLDTQLSSDQVTLGDVVYVTYSLNHHAAHGSPDFSPLQKDFLILNTNYGNTVQMV